MREEELYRMIDEREGGLSVSFPAVMRKVYGWMAMALAITGLTAYMVAGNAMLLDIIFGNRLVMWILILGELGLVMTLSAGINKFSATTATLLFVLYSVVNGATLSVIFLAYELGSIGIVFLISAGTFGVMALVGSTTKTDLTSMGKLLFFALIGLVIATVVNIFVGSSMLQLVVSCIGVLVFVGLTAYDAQKIKQMVAYADPNSETTAKLAILGALSLYLDFVNLFLYLLRLFGNRK